jgi:lysophospholipase L1-like esterase
MRWLRLVTAVVTCAVLVGVGVAPAAARDRGEDAPYLALGDSVAFGFNPLLDPHNAANFVGYPEVVAARLDLRLVNASCPGEASGGFISLTSPLDNGCRLYRAAFPLHVKYTTSQLDFAVAFLLQHPDTRLVTLDIGANDLFVLQKQCNNDQTCISNGLPGLLGTLGANLGTIYGRLRGEAHYRHRLVGLTYYALDFSNPAGVAVIQAINATVARATLAAHGRVANGFDAFEDIARFAGGNSCLAGLLIVTSRQPLTCDIHPSLLGRNALASAILQALHGIDLDGVD